MPDGQEVQFQSPTSGAVQAVPSEHWDEALKQGYKPTSHKVMYSPSGQRGMVANEELAGHMKQGYRTTPETQFEKSAPKIPEAYGATPSNLLRQGWEGVKDVGRFGRDVAKDISNPDKPLFFGSEESGPQESTFHKYVIAPSERENAKAQNAPSDAESIGHSIAAAVPGVGPWMAGLAEQAGTGDVGGAGARGLGQYVGGRVAGKVASKTADAGIAIGNKVGPVVSGALGESIGERSTAPIGRAAKTGVAKVLRNPEGEVRPEIYEPKRLVKSAVDKLAPQRPLKPEYPGAALPAAEEFYEKRGQDLERRGRQQEIMDRKAARDAKANAPKPSPFAGATSSGESVGTPIELPAPREQAPMPVVRTKAEVAAANTPKPSIVTPESGPRIESEGRPATWTNEKVLELAAKGNRAAIAQAGVRQLPMPPNARYVAGDLDYRNLITSPREVTKFGPTGEPIRQEAKQPMGRTADTVATASRAAKPTAQEPQRAGLNFEQSIAVPSERPIPPPEEAVGNVIPPSTPEAVSRSTVEEPTPTEVKGVTAPEKAPRQPREKPVPIEKRFSPDQITEAEGLLASESGAMGAADRPGTYFDESEAGDVRTSSRQRKGGDWRGVKSGRDMYPFMREHPEWGPEYIQKALRNKDSAAYRNVVEAAMEFMNRGNGVEADERAAIQDESIGEPIGDFLAPEPIGLRKGGLLADIPQPPPDPQELADLSKELGRNITAAEYPELRRRLDAEENINQGLRGNRRDTVGEIREQHRAKLEKKGIR